MRTSFVAELVGGSTSFVDDISVDGMVHGALVRMPVPHASNIEVDTTQAAAMPGVVRIVTAHDLMVGGTNPKFGPLVRDQPVLASTTSRYEGEPVAFVVAETEADARSAAQAVRVGFEKLPPVLSVEDALAATPIHDPSDRPPEHANWRETNVMGSWEFGWGDVDAERAEVAQTIEASYSAPFAHHFAIEMHGCIAIPHSGGVRIISSAQHPFIHRRVIAELLDLSIDSVEIAGAPMGGSFGSKGYPKVEPIAAVAAQIVGRPVKFVLTAEESFVTAQREASVITARSRFSADGRLLSQEIEIDFLVGAYADISPRVVAKSALHSLAPYHTPSARIRGRGLYSTTPPTTAFRGFGAVHTAFALEGQMDRAAAAMQIDPVELRRRNVRVKGAASAYGETPVDGDWSELLRMVDARIDRSGQRRKGLGFGVAMGVKTCIPATTSTARLQLRDDGTLVVHIGTSEMGQGTVAMLGELVSREVGIEPQRVSVGATDTASVPDDALTASSRSAVHMGNALMAACRELNSRLASGERPPTGGELVVQGKFAADSQPQHPLGGPTPFYEAVATGVTVEVDFETGEIAVRSVVHATDAGKVLDRQRATGLDEGGIVMGMGLATSEQLIHATDGRLLNGSSLDYRIPTIGDRPGEMVSLFLENGDGPGPYGAKGLAEGGILAIGPAIAAAVHDATGVFVDEIPITPERLWRRLRDKS